MKLYKAKLQSYQQLNSLYCISNANKNKKVFYINFLLFGACHYILSNADLKNVAYAKSVTLSSEYNTDRTYPGSKAVNGLLSDFAHTAHEKTPWLRIDLGANYRIHEIEVFARSDCCGM